MGILAPNFTLFSSDRLFLQQNLKEFTLSQYEIEPVAND
jgi:hypothetical protein